MEQRVRAHPVGVNLASVVNAKRANLADAAADLIDLANGNGGRDNISVILIRVPADFLPLSSWAQRWLARKKAS